MAIFTFDRIGPTLTDFGDWGFDLAGGLRRGDRNTPAETLDFDTFSPEGVLQLTVRIPPIFIGNGYVAEVGPFITLAAGDGLTVDGAGRLSGGQLRLFGSLVGETREQGVFDVRLDARSLLTVAASAGRADDDRLLRSLMGGDDVILLAEGNSASDVVASGAGDDIVAARGGADRVSGGWGRDFLLGGLGNDTLSGDGSNDVLFGDRGADRLFGGPGDDLLYGDYGADRMTGGPGADRFVIAADNAVDVVTDFQNGIDRLVFALGPARFSDLTLTGIDADSVRVAWAGGALRVDGIARSQLGADDMVFGATADAAIATRLDAVIDANAYLLG